MRLRFVLGLALMLTACSDGGGGSSIATVPPLPWGSFRQNFANSAAGAAIDRNRGNVRLFAAIDGVTTSTPAIDRNRNVFVGTTNGIVSFNSRGTMRWAFTEYPCPDDPSPDCTIPVGPVSSSPTVTAGGAILFGSEPTETQPGGLFYLQELQNRVEFEWIFQPPDATPDYGVRSSPIAQINPNDRSLLTVIFTGDDGVVRALNRDGAVRWAIQASDEPLTSTPGLDSLGTTYVTTPEGAIVAVDSNGRDRMWQANAGPPPPQALLPSPAIGANVYAVGAGGSLFNFGLNGFLGWQFVPDRTIVGSPAFLTQAFNFRATTVIDTIIYAVDATGTVYPVRDSDGTYFQVQRCTANSTLDCRMDSCAVAGLGECIQTGGGNRCSLGGIQSCSRDSCLPDRGTCQVINPNGAVQIPDPVAVPPQTVVASPIVSGDGFVVIGTTSGNVCARALNGLVPGQDRDSPPATWVTGCIAVDDTPILSSPALGMDGEIFVTTEAGLYIIE